MLGAGGHSHVGCGTCQRTCSATRQSKSAKQTRVCLPVSLPCPACANEQTKPNFPPPRRTTSQPAGGNSAAHFSTWQSRKTKKVSLRSGPENAVASRVLVTHGPAPRPVTLSVSIPSRSAVAPFSKSCFLSAVLSSACCVRTVLGARPLGRTANTKQECGVSGRSMNRERWRRPMRCKIGIKGVSETHAARSTP